MGDLLLQALKEGKGLFIISGKDLLNFHKQTMSDAMKERESLLIDRMLNVGEVVALLSTTPRSLRRWDHDGYLKSVRIGGVNKWRYRDVLKLMNGADSPDK